MTDNSIQTADNPKTTLLLGAINMDLIVETERLARAGETFVCDRLYTSGGGKAGNQAVAAARFANGINEVKMIGRVGNDSFGQELQTFMSEQGVNMNDVTNDPEIETGVAIIFIDPTGENYVHAIYGGNGKCGEAESTKAIESLTNAGVLLVQQEIPTPCSLETMREAKRLNVPVVLDPAPAKSSDEIPEGFYQHVDIITPNAWEAEALAGIPVNDIASAEKAASIIRERLGCDCVIITLAGDGVFVTSENLNGHFPSFEVDAVATVAAGDAFAGVLGQAITEGHDLEFAIRLAMAAGALCVSRPGTQSAMPTRAEVMAMNSDQD